MREGGTGWERLNYIEIKERRRFNDPVWRPGYVARLNRFTQAVERKVMEACGCSRRGSSSSVSSSASPSEHLDSHADLDLEAPVAAPKENQQQQQQLQLPILKEPEKLLDDKPTPSGFSAVTTAASGDEQSSSMESAGGTFEAGSLLYTPKGSKELVESGDSRRILRAKVPIKAQYQRSLSALVQAHSMPATPDLEGLPTKPGEARTIPPKTNINRSCFSDLSGYNK